MLNATTRLQGAPRRRAARPALVCVYAALTLTACGGGGSGGGGGAADTDQAIIQPPSNPIWRPRFTGDWLENGCVSIGSQSFKRLLRATELPTTGNTSLNYAEGVITYPNTSCSGTGIQAGPSAMGKVDFSRWDWTAESNLAAYWGTFTTVTNTKSQVIWVRKGDNLLCLLGDQTPSILPDLNAVAASQKTLPDLGCFTRV